ncbi:conserved hypothetical protein [Histoplasma mississippiense (nom. inval.)]|uniref:conserved hypothetical protein n=1 Tax=Ajellomyces capsulatus (strain NAm1 / WU24) TaxID=2059318 RepID=UPI000157CBAE|nr:conserved hypothetical protein [Histoplasma mississippiense (nom. inval.)]EDN10039.1 conserved hypothetical protein [Histoplasma mississippiense (nom. inval.)]
MADNSSPDYEALYRKTEAERRQAEELRRQAEERERHEGELRRQAEELRRQAEERERHEGELRRQAEERERHEGELRRQAEEREAQERVRSQPTTLEELIKGCHDSFSRPLQVGTPTRSTKGSIPPPTGKYCPTSLRFWSSCPVQLLELYDAVSTYLQPAGKDAPRLFTSLLELEGLGRRYSSRKLRSEKDLENYERATVEDHVQDIITELCKIPDARLRFRLGDGILFENHENLLQTSEESDVQLFDESSTKHPKPDSFCIHRINGSTNTLITTVEYKPPHKLSVENLRAGLRSMKLWEEIVQSDTIPKSDELNKDEKLRYNAEQLTCSVLVQEYHVMIQAGLEYSYITNGFAIVLLRVPYSDPSTLYYYLCEPNMDVISENPGVFYQSKTAIARILCLCLISFLSDIRDQKWRNAARSQLHIWKTSFDFTRSQIPDDELQQTPPGSEYASSEYMPSEHLPSSPLQPGHRVCTRSQTTCAPMDTSPLSDHMDSSDSDSNQTAHGRKRGFSQVISSPPSQRSSARPAGPRPSSGQSQHTARYCTQRCLLGLQQGGELDHQCPNFSLHRRGQNGDRHCIDARKLVQLLKEQLDRDLDHNCTPFGTCGSYGAPFKITCVAYGYTLVGKGTTSGLWKVVSREAEIYRVLQKAQGSAVPVFLGRIDLKFFLFLHGAGDIRHMLLMGWAGESIENVKDKEVLSREISRSKKEIRMLGVVHKDLRSANMLWNDELRRVLIIDFHRSDIDRRPMKKRVGSLKRPLHQVGMSKRPCNNNGLTGRISGSQSSAGVLKQC